ncbi:MAG: FtsX-like permease family protein [Spirochaetota bacterium]
MSSPLRVAARYLQGHFRRYVFVLAVLTLGFAFISVSSSLADGMQHAVTNAALRHYAGHVVVMGRDKEAGSMMVVDDPDAVAAAIERSGAPVERIIRRVHEYANASVFFQGDAVRLKDLFGVDFTAEADLFRTFEYAGGSFDPAWPPDTIVISEPTARQLRVGVGDRLTLRVETRDGQIDTRTLVVRGITADASIYGYARAYTNRETLAELMDLSPASYSVAGVVLPGLAEAETWARRIHDELSELVPVSEPPESRDALTAAFRARWDGVRYFVFELPVYISEVTDLLTAMQLGSYVLLGMIVLVVLAAVVVTYRVVLHDRTREIGTMLAVGFTRPWVVTMLLAEAALVLAGGIAAGLALSAGATGLLSYVSFDWIPGFEIFLQEGRLAARYTLHSVALNAAMVAGVVVLAIALMVRSFVRKEIPSLIKGETI